MLSTLKKTLGFYTKKKSIQTRSIFFKVDYMHTVCATFNFKTLEDKDKFIAILKTAEGLDKTRKFPGCRSIEVYGDTTNDKKLFVWQKWEKAEDHAAYLAMRKASGLLDAIVETLETPLDICHLSEIEIPQLTDKEAIVDAVFAAWGQGKYNLPGKEQEFAKSFTKDCTFTQVQQLKGKAGQVWRDVKGHKECLEMFDQMGPQAPAVVNMDNFQRKFSKEEGGIVFVKSTGTQICLATGKKADFTNYQEWTIENGLVKSCVNNVTNAASIEAIFE